MLGNAVAVVNSKGGVGKTSIVANLAGCAALGGWRVLAVDLDPQGNLARDLGYHDRSDQGRALLQAIMAGQPLEPMHAVRAGVDVVCGGAHTRRLADLLMVQALDGDRTAAYQLEPTLASIAGDYDLVLVDCPPASTLLVRAALAAVGFALIPTKIDDASIDGLEGLAEDIGEVVRTVNPGLRVLGVVLFDVGAGDRRLRGEARAELGAMLAEVDIPVLQATIRHSRKAARDLRRRGELAAEYERAALDAAPWYRSRSLDAPVFSAAAGGLAGDYQQLAAEVLRALTRDRDACVGEGSGSV